MGSLKHEHPYLYRRVRLKAILFLYFGLSLIFSNPGATQAARLTVIPSTVSIDIVGGVFLFIGLGLAAGVYRSRHTYGLARAFLSLGTGYAIFWLGAFLIAFFEHKIQSTFFIGLWAYLTYNLFYIAKDPGWAGINVRHTVLEHNNGRIERR